MTTNSNYLSKPLTVYFLDKLTEPLALCPEQLKELQDLVVNSGYRLLSLLNELQQQEYRFRKALKAAKVGKAAEIGEKIELLKSEVLFTNSRMRWRICSRLSREQADRFLQLVAA